MNQIRCTVAVVGAGPGGLSTAIELRRLGVEDVVLIDRESAAGGIPRHCGHSPFGMREFHRILAGPNYAGKLVRQAVEAGVKLHLDSTVTTLEPGGRLSLSTMNGLASLIAEKVVLCTGNRESSRHTRLVSGERPMGIVTAGALQSMVYLKKRRPFKRPVIIGSELIAFSALLTCRHAGIKATAIIEPDRRITTWRSAALLPRLLGTRLLLNTSLGTIHGRTRVESVELVTTDGNTTTLECDGVIFSGQFVSEASLIDTSHLLKDIRSGGPVVDQFYRCSDADYYACGNMLHPVDTAAWCWSEGRRVAACVNAALNGSIPLSTRSIEITACSDLIRYFTPQRIALDDGADTAAIQASSLQLRFADNALGHLQLRGDNQVLIKRKLHLRRERRALMPIPARDRLQNESQLSLEFLN